MATLRQVEYFSVTFSAATSKTHTLSTTLLDVNKSFMVFGIESSGNNTEDDMIMGVITNTTTLTFTRQGSSGTPTIKGYVVEFTAGVNVDHGTLTSFTSSENTAALSNVTDLSKAFLLTSGNAAGTTQHSADMYSARLFDSSGLKVGVTSGEYTGSVFMANVAYQAIEYDACSVQRGTMSDITSLSQTATITAVDRSKSFVQARYKFNSTSALTGMDEWTLDVKFDSTTQISATRSLDDGDALGDGQYEVVEFTDGNTVQEISESFVGTGSGTNTLTTLSESGANAIAFTGHNMCFGTTTQSGDQWGAAETTGQITSATNLTVTRGQSSNNWTGTYWVWDIIGGSAPVVTVPSTDYVAFIDETISLTSLVSVADSDSDLATIRVQCDSDGTVDVTNLSSCTVSAGTRGTTDFTLSGSQANLNTAIGTLTFYSGTTQAKRTITITATDDLALSDSATFDVKVGPTTITITPDTPGDEAAINTCLATLQGKVNEGESIGTVTMVTTDAQSLVDTDVITLNAVSNTNLSLLTRRRRRRKRDTERFLK